MRKTCLLMMLCCILTGGVFADTSWNVESGNWANAANWSDGVPDATDTYVNLRYSATSVCTLNTAAGTFNRFVVQNGQTWNIENGGSVGFGWSRVGRGSNAYVNLSGNGSFNMNNDDLYVGLEGGTCVWTMSDTSSLYVTPETAGGDELYIGEDGGTGTLVIIGSGVTVDVDRLRLTANNPGGTATLEYVMDAGGASTIIAERIDIGEAGDTHLVLSATADLAEQDIVLIETTGSSTVGGQGMFNTLTVEGLLMPSAAEGASFVLGGNVYALTYAYDGLNDVALVFVKSAAHMATDPVPANGAVVVPTISTLSWINPDPNDNVSDITCTVYFGMDPNRPQMDSMTLNPNISEVEINATNFPTYGILPLPDANDFYWIVDCVDDSIGVNPAAGEGLFWSFTTLSAPTFETHPEDLSVKEGLSAVFSVSVVDDTGVTYQWYKDANSLEDNARVSGSMTTTLTINDLIASDEGEYYCRATNAGGFTDSNTAILIIKRMLSYWSFETDNQSSIPGSPATLVYGSAPTVVTGVDGGNAVQFDGTNGLYAALADAPYWDSMNRECTVSVWVRNPGSWGPWAARFGESNMGWQLRAWGGSGVAFTLRGTDGDDDGPNPSLPGDGQWHNVVGVFTGSEKKIYVDGELVASQADGGTIASTTASVSLAFRMDAGGNVNEIKPCELDEVKLYNAALSSIEIADEYVTLSGADYVCDYEDVNFPFDFDFDDSCRIDLNDFAYFAAELWLNCARYPSTGCGL